MHFKIASKNSANDSIKKFGATHLISLNDPPQRTFQNRLQRNNHLTVHFEDTEDYASFNAPKLRHIREILAFGATIPRDAVVIVNCHAGMCRSTAVALGLAVQRYGVDALPRMAKAMVEQRPHACPNRLIAHLFDLALGTNGEILKIAEEISNKYMLDTHLAEWDKGYVLPPKEDLVEHTDVEPSRLQLPRSSE